MRWRGSSRRRPRPGARRASCSGGWARSTADGRLTDVGRRMSRLPVHPRLARLVVEGEARGVAAAAGLAAALIPSATSALGTRASFGGGPRRRRRDRGAEVLDLVDLFQQAGRGALPPATCCAGWSSIAARSRRSIARAGSLASGDGSGGDGRADGQRRQATETRGAAAGGAGGVSRSRARRRARRARTVVLAAGGSAELGYEATGEWLVAVDAEERSAGARRPSGGAHRASRCGWDR